MSENRYNFVQNVFDCYFTVSMLCTVFIRTIRRTHCYSFTSATVISCTTFTEVRVVFPPYILHPTLHIKDPFQHPLDSSYCPPFSDTGKR